MTFNSALDKCKYGAKIARAGWYPKDQYIQLAANITYTNPKGQIIKIDDASVGSKALAFVGASGIQIGWTPSQADMLAGDWITVQ